MCGAGAAIGPWLRAPGQISSPRLRRPALWWGRPVPRRGHPRPARHPHASWGRNDKVGACARGLDSLATILGMVFWTSFGTPPGRPDLRRPRQRDLGGRHPRRADPLTCPRALGATTSADATSICTRTSKLYGSPGATALVGARARRVVGGGLRPCGGGAYVQAAHGQPGEDEPDGRRGDRSLVVRHGAAPRKARHDGDIAS